MNKHWSVHECPTITPEGVDLNVEVRFVAQDDWFVTLMLTPEQAHLMSADLDQIADGYEPVDELSGESPLVPVALMVVFYAGVGLGALIGGRWAQGLAIAMIGATVPLTAWLGRRLGRSH